MVFWLVAGCFVLLLFGRLFVCLGDCLFVCLIVCLLACLFVLFCLFVCLIDWLVCLFCLSLLFVQLFVCVLVLCVRVCFCFFKRSTHWDLFDGNMEATRYSQGTAHGNWALQGFYLPCGSQANLKTLLKRIERHPETFKRMVRYRRRCGGNDCDAPESDDEQEGRVEMNLSRKCRLFGDQQILAVRKHVVSI